MAYSSYMLLAYKKSKQEDLTQVQDQLKILSRLIKEWPE